MQYGARGDSLIGVVRVVVTPAKSSAAATVQPMGARNGAPLMTTPMVAVSPSGSVLNIECFVRESLVTEARDFRGQRTVSYKSGITKRMHGGERDAAVTSRD